MNMRINLILKKLFERIIITIILLIVKNYIDLDFINDSVDNLIIAISALLWDFNPFTFEITKVYFNGNSGDEGEGSNRQNNPQGSSINPSTTSSVYYEEVEGGIVVSGEALEEIKALYGKNSEFFGRANTILDEIAKGDAEQKRRITETIRIIEEREAEIKKRIINFEDLKNQGQSDESIIGLNDIEDQIVEDIKALNVDKKKVSDKFHAHKAEVKKLYEDTMKVVAKKIEGSINEDNSK